jgi:hypothetical protein
MYSGKPQIGMRLDTTSFIADRLSFTIPAHEGFGQELSAFGMAFPDGQIMTYNDCVDTTPTIDGVGVPWVAASSTNTPGRVQYPGNGDDPVVWCYPGMGAMSLHYQDIPYFAADTPNALTVAVLICPTISTTGTYRLFDSSRGSFGFYQNLTTASTITASGKTTTNTNISLVMNYTLGDWVLALYTLDGANNGYIYNFGVQQASSANYSLSNTWAAATNASTYQISPWGTCAGGGPDNQFTNAALVGYYGGGWVWKNRFFSAQDVAAFAADPFQSYESGLQRMGNIPAFQNVNSGAMMAA